MKIAVFHLGFFFSGGGEKLVLQEVKALIKDGHEIDVYAPVVDVDDCFPDLIKHIKIFTLFNPFSFNFPLRDFIAIAGSVFFTPLTFWRFKKYDLFYGANQPGPLICYCLSKLTGKPYVIYLAQPTRLIYPRPIDIKTGFGKGSFNVFYVLAKIFKPLVRHLDKISIESADKVLINGRYMAGVLRRYYKIKGVVCPAGVNPESLKRGFKPFMLVTNRHFPQKRLDYALIALKKVLKTNKNLRLLVTGAFTSYTKHLVKLSTELGIRGRVDFLGLVSEKKLEKLYRDALVYLYTSPEEDFGMGVIEAQAFGIPVIAWDKAGPGTTVVNGKTGYLIKPGDMSEFVKKLEILLGDKKLNIIMGRAGRRHVADNFSQSFHQKILTKTFSEVIDAK